MADKVLQEADALFSSLSQAVFLLDRQGRCVVPRQPDTFLLPSSLQEDTPIKRAGYQYLLLPGLETYILATKDRPEAGDLLLLCGKLIRSFQQERGITSELGNAFKRLLREQLSPKELEALVHDHGVKENTPRAIVFINFPNLRQPLPKDALVEYIPVSENDHLVMMDSRSFAVARDLTEEGPEELTEYAMALLDTLQNELGLHVLIGIGDAVPSLAGLSQSLKQAEKAISIGSILCPEAQIFSHSALILERFLMDCAPEEAAPYVAAVFNKKTAKLFTEEMLETVNVFIDKDLNLTDAARELYIHRNTLVYRLDKIQKLSGLDLRHFKDAMLFKLADGLRRREAGKARKA